MKKTKFRLRRLSDNTVLCTDGAWRLIGAFGGMTGHAAKIYMSKGGAGDAASHLPFVVVIEEAP